MPLTGTESVYSAALRAALLADAANTKAVDGPALTALCNAIANTIIPHLVANVQVNSLGLIAPPGAGGGPVTGLTTIT